MGVPYSDTFSVGVQYCLSRVSANQCRIRIHAGVVYKKSCWGIVKSELAIFSVWGALAGIMWCKNINLGQDLHGNNFLFFRLYRKECAEWHTRLFFWSKWVGSVYFLIPSMTVIFSDTHLNAECARFGLTEATDEAEGSKTRSSRSRQKAAKVQRASDEESTRAASRKRACKLD